MKKLFIVIVFVLLAACVQKATEGGNLSDSQRQYYGEKAKEIVGLFNEGEGEDILAVSTDTLKEAIGGEKMATIFAQLRANGQFVEYGESEVVAVTQNEKVYYTVILETRYSEKTVIFTISFDENDQLAGIYYK